LRGRAVHVGILVDVSTRFGRVEVGLAFLKMFDLAGGVLGPREATMQTSHFRTLVKTVNNNNNNNNASKTLKRMEAGQTLPWKGSRCPGTLQRRDGYPGLRALCRKM